jgi:predicted metalloprotease with PDZ domain
MRIITNHYRKLVLLLALLAIQVSLAFAQNSITLNVDASEAAKNILHVRETITVKPGAFTLFYPKWIPGEHAPTGTLNNMVNLFISANGKALAWQRDDVEMFAFHLAIPADVTQIEIAFDDVSQPGTTMSAQLARIKWNRLILYPEGAKSDDVQITASMKLPDGWKYAVALPVAKDSKNAVDFGRVNLTTFVDSPAIIGKYFRKTTLSNDGGILHEMDIAADTEDALKYKPETLKGWENLVKEAHSMFGAHHYNRYQFLLTLSDVGGDEGLEHHESSEDGVAGKSLSDPYLLIELGDLLGHEYAHSWNGKYRRPVGLATGDFETPMRGDLLWVYEGLTQYLGHILPTRSQLWTPETYREVLASDAAYLDNQTGRRWRPLVDTARAVQFTYGSPRLWRNVRRGVDYYDEGALVWLEADVLIRQKSGGKLSLDSFLQRFHGGQNTAPKVVPYDLDEIVRTLNEVLPYDWRAFLNERIYAVLERAPLGGITNGGWKLIYTETPNSYIQGGEANYSFINASYSIGLRVDSDGTIEDVNPDLPGAKAGLAPGMTIKKVNGEDFSLAEMHKAIADTKKSSTIELIAENGGDGGEIYRLNYSGGEKYPHLVRDLTTADLLSEVIKPRGNIPLGFVPSGDPSSILIQLSPNRPRNNRQVEVINPPANVTKIVLSRTEIALSDADQKIDVSVEAFDSDNDVLTYAYTVSGGKIVGQGAKVVWDLSGVEPGTYTITVGVDDGCGICGTTKTMEIKVIK